MKACIDCKYFGRMGPVPACCGPHLEPKVVSGTAFEMLPEARFAGYNPQTQDGGVKEGMEPCGKAGRYWTQAPTKPDTHPHHAMMVTLGLLAAAFIVGFFMRGCFGG